MKKLTSQRKLKSLCALTAGGLAAYAGISLYKGEERFYTNFVMPVVHQLDGEQAHKLAVFANKHRLIPKSRYQDPDLLKIKVLGMEFKNPVGVAAGFDKNGEAIQGLADIGFGFVEIGSVTPEPQPGNEKPRVFRLKPDLAVINRYGFNNDGHEIVHKRLQLVKESGNFETIVGVNLGKNKTSPDAVADYVKGVRKFGEIADYLVINISSPNTPGLRDMQAKKNLVELLTAVVEARNNLQRKTPLLLKLSPDLSESEMKDIAEVIRYKNCKIDGLIISNTTVAERQFLADKRSNEIGGLSGQPLKERSTQMVRHMYKLTSGEIPIIGVGGVSDAKDAYEKIKSGASIVQVYTGMIYEGPPIVNKIKRGLVQLLAEDGIKDLKDAVGKDVH